MMPRPDQPADASPAAAGAATASTPTGHARVDDVVAALDAAAESPPAGRIAPLSEADRILREALDSIGDV